MGKTINLNEVLGAKLSNGDALFNVTDNTASTDMPTGTTTITQASFTSWFNALAAQGADGDNNTISIQDLNPGLFPTEIITLHPDSRTTWNKTFQPSILAIPASSPFRKLRTQRLRQPTEPPFPSLQFQDNVRSNISIRNCPAENPPGNFLPFGRLMHRILLLTFIAAISDKFSRHRAARPSELPS